MRYFVRCKIPTITGMKVNGVVRPVFPPNFEEEALAAFNRVGVALQAMKVNCLPFRGTFAWGVELTDEQVKTVKALECVDDVVEIKNEVVMRPSQ